MTIYICECNSNNCPYGNHLPDTVSDRDFERIERNQDLFIIHKDCLTLPANVDRYDIVGEFGELLSVRWKDGIF